MQRKIPFLVLGIVGALFPRSVIDGAKKLLLWPSYENPEDLEPRNWVVRFVRVQSLLLAVVALYTITNSKSIPDPEVPDVPDLTPSED